MSCSSIPFFITRVIHPTSVILRFEQVFPATEIEGFLVHHRANIKNGNRGESIPAVPISMIRFSAEQFLRDAEMLKSKQRRLY